MRPAHRREAALAGLALACLALAVAGCAVGPNFHRPAPPEKAGYSPVPLPGETASSPGPAGDAQRFMQGQDVDARWWQSFGSPQLDALVERAFRVNPSVKAAQAALREAEQLVYAQQGYFFPSIGADYSIERQKLAGNLTGSNAPGVQGNGTSIVAYQNPSPATSVHNQPLYYNFHTAELTVGFVPDVFGANRRKVESLEAEARIQRFELEATYVSLAANVVAAAIQEASTRAELAAVEDIIEKSEKSLALMREKLDQGYASALDAAGMELALAQARALLPPLQKQFEQNRDLIRALVGNLPDQEVPAAFDLHSLALPTHLPLSLPSRIIEQRPDIRAAEENMRSANANVGAAVAAMLPQFNITGSVGGTATQFSQMFASGAPSGP